MKQKIFCLFVMLLACAVQTNVLAQSKNDNKRLSYEQRVEKQAQNVAKSMLLNDKEEAEFIPLYVQYLKDMRNTSRSGMQMDFGKDNFNKEKLTDAQIDKLIQIRFDRCQKILDVRKQYYGKFKEILTARQIMKMYTIEHNFGKKMKGEFERRYNKNGTKR